MFSKIKKYHWITIAVAIVVVVGVVLYFTLAPKTTDTRPNIIIIIADDLGHNDLGFHGTDQIQTPNLDALAYNGIILDRFYTQSACTPSRAALLTGQYPIRLGVQVIPMRPGEDLALPVDVSIMPEHFKQLGYKTHLVGKWHQGMSYRRNLPTQRGFDTHFGYWNGFVGYFDYVANGIFPNGTVVKGFDLYDGFTPAWPYQGTYATYLFTQKTLQVIDSHDTTVPLFLVVGHLAAHTGKDGLEMEVPNMTLADSKYSYINETQRRRFAEVVNLLDDSVGKIVKKLGDRNMLENSIILFFSDNGAQTTGVYGNSGSNWPLRGLKMTEFEGGVRTAGAIFSPLLKKRGYVNKNPVHLIDWLPTFYAAAGGDLADLGKIDGVNQWEALSNNLTVNRSEILLNINDVTNTSAILSQDGRYKFLQGTFNSGDDDRYFGSSGRGLEIPPYNVTSILDSYTNLALQTLNPRSITKETIAQLRAEADVSWCRTSDIDINCAKGCLFDMHEDPCETTNIIELKDGVTKKLRERIEELSVGVVSQPRLAFDPKSDPVNYNNTWCTWLDDELCTKTENIERIRR